MMKASSENTWPEGMASLNFLGVEMLFDCRGKLASCTGLSLAFSTTRLMSATAMAKFRFCTSGRVSVFRPINSPSVFTSGPPLFPPEMAAVVCTQVADSS